MALPWRATRRQTPHREPERSVADVVHQLQDLSRELRLQVDRLEQANNAAADQTFGESR